MNITRSKVRKTKGGGLAPISPYKEEVLKKFVEFCAMPDPEKCEMFEVPFDEKKGKFTYVPNQGHFALKFGVSEKTLWTWKARPDFYAAVDRKQKAWGLDKVPNVMAALYRRCLRFGISSDIELYLAYYAQWDRKHVVKFQGEKYDLDDVRALVAMLPEDKQKSFYETITNIIGEAEVYGGGAKVSEYGPKGSSADTIDVRDESDKALALIGAEHQVSKEA